MGVRPGWGSCNHPVDYDFMAPAGGYNDGLIPPSQDTP